MKLIIIYQVLYKQLYYYNFALALYIHALLVHDHDHTEFFGCMRMRNAEYD